jgi:hypothetical protein
MSASNRVVANPDGVTVSIDAVLTARQARHLASGLLLAAMAIEKETGPLGVLYPREEVNATMRRYFEDIDLLIRPATPDGGRPFSQEEFDDWVRRQGH